MMNIRKTTITLAASLAGFVLSAPASAAFINIDDSDLTWITITAGDFEGGFYVNGDLLTEGIDDSGSITLTDGPFEISGAWVDDDVDVDGSRVDLLFALAGNPGFATSGIVFEVSSEEGSGILTGSFSGYVDPSFYSPTLRPTLLQDGRTGFASVASLSVSFISENPIPEPASLALLGIGLAGLGAMRRRKAA